VSIGFSYGDDDTHARRATEVQWWSDQSLCHVAVNEMRGAGPFSDRIESSVPSAVLQVLRELCGKLGDEVDQAAW
jgi:hypothetical protein